MARAVDKMLLFNTFTNSNGADGNSKLGQITLFDNSSGVVNYTLDSVSCSVSIRPTAVRTVYFGVLFVTDPGGSLPTGSDGVSLGAFNTWLKTYRRQIWMTMGGEVGSNAALPDEEKVMQMEARTKRTLKPGQKLILAVWTWNRTSTADVKDMTYDVNIFYHY